MFASRERKLRAFLLKDSLVTQMLAGGAGFRPGHIGAKPQSLAWAFVL